MVKEKKFKIIFMGTPDFALPSLDALIKSDDFDVVLVVTQVDKKIGRKQIVTPPPVKVNALENNIPVLQPEKIKDIIDNLRKLEPDFIVVAAYGQIIPKGILDIPKYGPFNIHGSLLPKYRGAAVVQAPILNGDVKTGITIIKMEAGLDTGPILKQAEIILDKKETSESLFDKLSKLGAEILPEALISFANGKLKLEKQDESKASYVKMLKKEDGKIDWTKSAVEIERMVRALNPWPGAYAQIKDKKEKIRNIKILKVKNDTSDTQKYKVGEVFLEKNILAVQCGDGAIVVEELQMEGKKKMSAKEFLQGHKDFVGTILK